MRYRVVVLRYGHRPARDKRITTHVCLVARAFGADGVYIDGQEDSSLVGKLREVCENWGRKDFFVRFSPWKEVVKEWRGEKIHLTMYGLHVDDVIEEIRKSPKDKLVIVGGPKVPSEFFELADYNVAIGNQPHSEVAALAIFLDRLFEGKELRESYGDAKLIIIPSAKGKLVRCRNRKTTS